MPPHPTTHVATLVSAPERLDADLVAIVAAALPGATEPSWLAVATAADISFAPPPAANNAARSDAGWTETARVALGGAPVDVVVQPAAGRRKRLLVADMDATLIEEECIDEMATAHGCGAAVAALTSRSTSGDIDFATSLIERVALLRGLPVAAVEAVALRAVPVAGARALAATMRAHGATTVIASGGFTLVTGPVAARLGFDRHYSNTLDVEAGKLAGTMRPPLFLPASKRDVLLALRDEFGLAADETLAVGDGANDIPLLREAGLGVAFRAKPLVAAAVPARLDHADLTGLLYVQGYGETDICDVARSVRATAACGRTG